MGGKKRKKEIVELFSLHINSFTKWREGKQRIMYLKGIVFRNEENRKYTAVCKKCSTTKKSSKLNEICGKCHLEDVKQSNKGRTRCAQSHRVCAAPCELMLKEYK